MNNQLYKLFLILFLFVTFFSAFPSPLLARGEEDLEAIFDEEASKGNPEKGDSNGENRPTGFLPDGMGSGTLYRGESGSLGIMAAADLLGEWDKEQNRSTIKEGRDPAKILEQKWEEWQTEPQHATDNRGYVRSIELGFTADVDWLGRGTVLAAAHDEGGQTHFDVHEASFYFPRTFLPNTSLKIGRFLMDAGRLNTMHQHDWSFTRTPVVHQQLMADEGIIDYGAELSFLMPWSFWQELTVGVYNGREFGEDHEDPTVAEENDSRQNPIVNLHLKQYFNLGKDWGTQFGFTYLRWHTDTKSTRYTQQWGFDLLFKWKKGKERSFQWLTEAWYREERDRKRNTYDEPALPMETYVGAYTFFEYQFLEQWFAGVRYDYFTSPTMRAESGVRSYPPVLLKTADGGTASLYDGWTESYTVKNGVQEGAFMITYRPSEFSFFRATVTKHYDRLIRDTDWIYSLQATFIIGKHPAHRY